MNKTLSGFCVICVLLVRFPFTSCPVNTTGSENTSLQKLGKWSKGRSPLIFCFGEN